MNPKTTRIILAASAFLLGLVLFFVTAMLMGGRSATPVAAIGGSFTLTNQNGAAVTDTDFKGKPYLVFFGFTHCPDVCPTTLFEISEVMRALGNDAGRVNALFVTVDPERDTPAAMKDYLSSFDPHISGLTGDTAAIAAVEKSYRVYAKKVPTTGGDYTMDHTAIVYLMDKTGKFVRPFDTKRKPDEAAAELRRYL
ncbi:MAG: SCO family protein [Rhizobiales bacterium]|nr:SCO family protein [Hyphomicrobiales bacterium]OJY45154.1 MAG: copper-binding protein [Rhizobiales bacterium 64-17]